MQFGQSLDYPTVDVNVDREKAGLMGVKMADVSRSLVTATSSSRFVVPNYWADPNSGVSYQIQVQVPQAHMDSLEQAENVPVIDRDGQGSCSATSPRSPKARPSASTSATTCSAWSR